MLLTLLAPDKSQLIEEPEKGFFNPQWLYNLKLFVYIALLAKRRDPEVHVVGEPAFYSVAEAVGQPGAQIAGDLCADALHLREIQSSLMHAWTKQWRAGIND